jgi:hypothetical protein
MKKIGKTQEIKKNPSLIFDIFRDGKASFVIKNNNFFKITLFCKKKKTSKFTFLSIQCTYTQVLYHFGKVFECKK